MVRDWTSGRSLPVKDFVGNPTPLPLGKTLPTTCDVIQIQEAGPILLPEFFQPSPPPPPPQSQPLFDLSHANLLKRGGHRSYFRREWPGLFVIRAHRDAHNQKLKISATRSLKTSFWISTKSNPTLILTFLKIFLIENIYGQAVPKFWCRSKKVRSLIGLV